MAQTIGGRTVDEVLVDYDGPRLFVSTDPDGSLCLGLSVVDDHEVAQFWLIPTTDDVVAGLRSGELPLREPFETARAGTLITVTQAGTATEALDGPIDHLPDHGVRLGDLVDLDALTLGSAPVAIEFGGLSDLVQRTHELIASLARQRSTGLRFAAPREVVSHERHEGLEALRLGPALLVSVMVAPDSDLVTLTVSVEPAGRSERATVDAVVTLDAGPRGVVMRRVPFNESDIGPLTAEFPNLDVRSVRRIEVAPAAGNDP